jgi:transcriptional regulator with XRE-family HTH domain
VTQPQQKKSDSVFGRLRRLQRAEGMTWNQVAEKLNISVSMLMMVKSGSRNLSEKALYRLDRLEKEIEDRKSGAERVVEALINDEGTAAYLIHERHSKALLTAHVEYRDGPKTNSLPIQITLVKPSTEACTKLRQLFAETLDTKMVLLACLPSDVRSDAYVARLTSESRARLTRRALDIVIPQWRNHVAGQASDNLE